MLLSASDVALFSPLCSAFLCSQADSLWSCCIWFSMCHCSLIFVFVFSAFWISTEVVSTYSTLWLLYGWCHFKLLPPGCMFSVHHIIMHQFTLSLHSKPHTQGACVFSCNLPLRFLAEWPGWFTCHCCNTAVEQIPKWVSTESWPWGRTFSHRACGDLNQWPFAHE